MYTDLIHINDLERDAISVDIFDIDEAAKEVITGVTSTVEEYLERDLIVRKHTLLHEDVDYMFDTAVSTDAVSNYSFYAGQWPVLQVDSVTPSGFTINIHPDGRRLYTDFDGDDQPIRQIDYFAGYKRTDQTLSDLQSEVSGLTATPDDLPADIRMVATRLVMHFLKEVDDGVLGRRTVTASGPVNITVEGTDGDFVGRQLRRLNKHRSLAW